MGRNCSRFWGTAVNKRDKNYLAANESTMHTVP